MLRWLLQNGVENACKDAGLDDATASRFNDMALYAAYAVNASVRKSGQSAFTWIPLQGTVHAAVEAVPEAGRPAFTQAFIAAVTGVSHTFTSANLLFISVCQDHAERRPACLVGRNIVRGAHALLARTMWSCLHWWMQVLKHVEEQESLDSIDGPPDLAEGSRLIHDIMSSTNKVSILHSINLLTRLADCVHCTSTHPQLPHCSRLNRTLYRCSGWPSLALAGAVQKALGQLLTRSARLLRHCSCHRGLIPKRYAVSSPSLQEIHASAEFTHSSKAPQQSILLLHICYCVHGKAAIWLCQQPDSAMALDTCR